MNTQSTSSEGGGIDGENKERATSSVAMSEGKENLHPTVEADRIEVLPPSNRRYRPKHSTFYPGAEREIVNVRSREEICNTITRDHDNARSNAKLNERDTVEASYDEALTVESTAS